MNNIDKPLARLTRVHRDSIQINKSRNKKEDVKTDTEQIQKIISSTKAYTQHYRKMDKMDNFLDRYQIPVSTEDHIEHLNSPITPKEIEAVIESLTRK